MIDGLRIIRGMPTDEELAALVGALLALPAPAVATPPVVSRWARSGRPAPRLGTRGPEAWRASALPRPR